MDLEDIKIEIFPKDDVGENKDNCYCAIVLGLLNNEWFNTGIVIREKDAIIAFITAMQRAKEKGWWK